MLGAGHTGAQPSQAATVPLAGARRERLLAWTKRQASALRPRPRSGRAKVERCRAGGRTPRAGVPESSAGGSRRCNRRADRGVAPQLARAGAAAADRSLPAGRQPARCAAARRSARQRESAGYAAAFALTDAEGGGKFPNLKRRRPGVRVPGRLGMRYMWLPAVLLGYGRGRGTGSLRCLVAVVPGDRAPMPPVSALGLTRQVRPSTAKAAHGVLPAGELGRLLPLRALFIPETRDQSRS